MLRVDFTRNRLFSKLFFPSTHWLKRMTQAAIFTVTQLNAEVRQVLEQGFGNIWLLGEISNFSAPSSGHWYFTLKDERAQIKAAMFRGSNQRVRLRPANGMQVLVRAKLTVYEPRGDYQLLVEHMEDAGAGLLQQRYEQLKAKLAAAGLFDAAHKQPLPEMIRRVGVITSPSGAAIRDILAVLKRRDPSVEVIIYPATVQGQQAAQELLQMVQLAGQRQEVDVLILARGGGSLEDLWCFNDEALAQAIYQCPLPTISAVGHEIDFTIADFVADVRAPTPSAAAELVSRDQQQWLLQLQQLQRRLQTSQQRLMRQLSEHLQRLQQRLQRQDPQRQLLQQYQRLDDLQGRLKIQLGRLQQSQQQRLLQLQQRLQRLHPSRSIQQAHQQVQQLEQRLQRLLHTQQQQRQQQFQQLLQQLQLVSPLQTLARGYAVVLNQHQQVVRDPAALATDERFRVKVAGGEFTARKLAD